MTVAEDGLEPDFNCWLHSLQGYGVFAEHNVHGIIEVPEPFYDYGKKDKAAEAARWASEMAARAAVEAEKTASKQAAVQQAEADEVIVQAVKAAKAAKAAAKAAKRVAKKTEKNATAKQQSELAAEEKTEKAARDMTTKQEVAQVQVQNRHIGIYSSPIDRPVESLGRLGLSVSSLERDLTCCHAKLLPSRD